MWQVARCRSPGSTFWLDSVPGLNRNFGRTLLNAAVLVCVVAAPAHAHSGFAGMSDFWNGFLHLVVAPEQCVTLFALGLVMARLETDDADAPFHLYLIGLATGLIFGVLALPAETEVLRAAPLVFAGLLLVDPAEGVRKVPRAFVVAAALVAGLSFGSAVPPESSRLVFAGGMFLGAILFPTYAMVVW